MLWCMQLEALQASIDEAYRDCFAGVDFQAPADEEGGAEEPQRSLHDVSEAAFADLGRTRPRVGWMHDDFPVL